MKRFVAATVVALMSFVTTLHNYAQAGGTTNLPGDLSSRLSRNLSTNLSSNLSTNLSANLSTNLTDQPISPIGQSATTTPIGQTANQIGQPTTVIGQPTTVIGQPTTVIGQPTTIIGQPTTGIGQPNRIIPPGTTVINPAGQVVVPAGTNPVAPAGGFLQPNTRGIGTGIGQQNATAIGQQGSLNSSNTFPNGFTIHSDGSVTAINPQGGSTGAGLGGTGTGVFIGTNISTLPTNSPNPANPNP